MSTKTGPPQASPNVNPITFLITFYRRFSRLSAGQFKSHLISILQTSKRINPVDAKLLGEFILQRRWHECANHIARDIIQWDRLDLVPAMQECHSLLGLFERFELWLSGRMQNIPVSQDDWWDAFTDVMIELYHRGPDDREIWSRAGGEDGVLEYNGDGRTRWKQAIDRLRHGGGGKNIDVFSLLGKARKEFPNNDRLRMLIETKGRL